jgi:transcriptional regulator with XRE-family HTH domain
LAETASQISERLKSLRKRAGITQAELAAAIDVDAQTVARWERGERRPNAEAFEAAVAHLNAVVAGLSKDVSRETPRPDIPEWLDARAAALDRELTRAGATDAQLDYIKSIMRSPATLKFVLRNDDGSPRPAAEQQQQLELFIDGMRFWLARSATPGGAPIAPVIPTQDPGAAKPNVAQPGGKKK